MSPRAVDQEPPDRLYTVTQGRTVGDDDPFDLVSLIVSERDPAPGMQSEHVRILQICRDPVSVAELSAELELPVSVVKVLLLDLRDTGGVTIRHPLSGQLPDHNMLKQVLRALEKL
jgi:uncharacterized protein DUF742